MVLVVAGSVIVLAAIYTAYGRLFRPVYKGAFSLLITDPINSQSQRARSLGQMNGSMFEQLARNTTSSDIPTLIAVLKSPVLLQPIAEQFETPIRALSRRINIVGKLDFKSKNAEGVLNVSLTGRNREQSKTRLDSLSNSELQGARPQRQQRLADGLDFLNNQAPQLQANLDQIQREIAEFRVRHSLLEPTLEGGALKKREA